MVRLEYTLGEIATRLAANFNSSMVRLEWFLQAFQKVYINQFQFLNGAIRIGSGTRGGTTSMGFQFLNGAIRIAISILNMNVSLLFQFLNGAIRIIY